MEVNCLLDLQDFLSAGPCGIYHSQFCSGRGTPPAGSSAMTSILKSEAAFVSRAEDCGLGPSDVAVLTGKGIKTLATLAYALAAPGATPSEDALRGLLNETHPDTVSLQALAFLRRMVFEAQTLSIAQIKQVIENEGEAKVDLVPASEAFTRRALACDLMQVATFSTMERYRRFLLSRLAMNPPPNHKRVSMEQLLRADRAAWIRLAELVTTLKRDPTGNLPLDAAIANLMGDTLVTFHLMPLPGKGGPRDETHEPGRARKGREKSVMLQVQPKTQLAKALGRCLRTLLTLTSSTTPTTAAASVGITTWPKVVLSGKGVSAVLTFACTV